MRVPLREARLVEGCLVRALGAHEPPPRLASERELLTCLRVGRLAGSTPFWANFGRFDSRRILR